MGLINAKGDEVFLADGTARITRKSFFSGTEASMVLRVTRCQFDRWRAGQLIQDAMPELTNEQREFIMTGVTPEEWAQEFGGDDE